MAAPGSRSTYPALDGLRQPGSDQDRGRTCPGNRRLFGGGFQRTDFTARGGDYITESRAISDKSWSVTGRAFGGFGGQLTVIAYCWHSRKPLLTEVSGSATVPAGRFATHHPVLPGGPIVFGGFSTSPAGAALFTNGFFTPSGGWSASAMNTFGPTATLHGIRVLPEALDSLEMERTLAV